MSLTNVHYVISTSLEEVYFGVRWVRHRLILPGKALLKDIWTYPSIIETATQKQTERLNSFSNDQETERLIQELMVSNLMRFFWPLI